MLGIGQLDVNSREVERIIFDRELVVAVRDEAGQTAMPVERMEQLDPLAPDLPHLEREKVEKEASGIGGEPERISAVAQPVGPGRERRDAKLAVNRAMIDADFERDKLEADPLRPRYLITETGVGYRLLSDD